MSATGRLPAPQVELYEWQRSAACRETDPGLFFHPWGEPRPSRRTRIAQAKTVCRACPVIQQCLVHALKVPEPYGIWGGASEAERAAMLGVQSLAYFRPQSTTTSADFPDGRRSVGRPG